MPQPDHDRTSLERPPVFRRMLSGGDPLHLGRGTFRIALLASLAAALIGFFFVWRIKNLFDGVESSFDFLGVTIHTIFIFANSMLLARFLARWQGGRAATIVTLVFCSTPSVVLGLTANLPTLCLIGGMYAFARQAVAGRLPLDERFEAKNRWICWICWILLAVLIVGFGRPLGMLMVVVWVLFGLISQNGRFLKRLFWPTGLAVLGMSILVSWWIGRPVVSMESYFYPATQAAQPHFYDFAFLLLPWWPISLGTLYLGLRHGYYALPLFQFIAVWIGVTVLAIALGLISPMHGLSSLTPSLAVATVPALLALSRLATRRQWW